MYIRVPFQVSSFNPNFYCFFFPFRTHPASKSHKIAFAFDLSLWLSFHIYFLQPLPCSIFHFPFSSFPPPVRPTVCLSSLTFPADQPFLYLSLLIWSLSTLYPLFSFAPPLSFPPPRFLSSLRHLIVSLFLPLLVAIWLMQASWSQSHDLNLSIALGNAWVFQFEVRNHSHIPWQAALIFFPFSGFPCVVDEKVEEKKNKSRRAICNIIFCFVLFCFFPSGVRCFVLFFMFVLSWDVNCLTASDML